MQSWNRCCCFFSSRRSLFFACNFSLQLCNWSSVVYNIHYTDGRFKLERKNYTQLSFILLDLILTLFSFLNYRSEIFFKGNSGCCHFLGQDYDLYELETDSIYYNWKVKILQSMYWIHEHTLLRQNKQNKPVSFKIMFRVYSIHIYDGIKFNNNFRIALQMR